MLKVTQFSASAIVQVNATPLTLSNVIEAEVERLWQAEQARRGKALFNGKILSAVEITPNGILGQIVEYRHLIAQRAQPELFGALNVRPVAVSGLLDCANGIVFGRRAGSMTQDAGLWELAPSGGLDTSKVTGGGGIIDYRTQILAELKEEIGINPDAISNVKPFCLVDDLDSHVIDIGIALSSRLSADEVKAIHQDAATKEYDELLVVPHSEVAKFIADHGQQLVGVSAALIEHFRP